MADRYRYIGEQHKTFMAVQKTDGSTLEVDPYDEFTLAKDPKHPEIVKVDRPSPESKGTRNAPAAKREKIASPPSEEVAAIPETPVPPADE